MTSFCIAYIGKVWNSPIPYRPILLLLAFLALLIGTLYRHRTLKAWVPISLKAVRVFSWGLITFAVLGLIEVIVYRVLSVICLPMIFGGGL